MKENIISLYAKKTGRAKDEVTAWMDAESWWTGPQAKVATWAKAGQMLGVSNRPARLETFDTDDGGPSWPPNNGGGPVTITYAPTIIVQGNASREDIDAALRDDKARFDAWYEEKRRKT